MSFVLLVIGVLAAAIGAIMVGFGVPINEFSLGNTLIIAGTTALMGGLIVVGLALALRQLSNLASALTARPVSVSAPASARSAEAIEPAPPRPGGPRMPMPVPARPDVPQPRVPRTLEPRIAESAPDDTADLPPPPRTPVRPTPPAADSALEMPNWRPPRPAAPEMPARKEAPRVSPPERRGAADVGRGTEGSYDAIWSKENRAAPPERIEPQAPETGPTAAATPNARSEPVSVLKSGVVDGMAYTLYTDGSIEAELAQGVVRFGSIEELRNHLEKSAS